MEIIDNVWIGTVEEGDYIEFFDVENEEPLGILEVKSVEDDGVDILITSVHGDEMVFDPEDWVDIYGYTSIEDI